MIHFCAAELVLLASIYDLIFNFGFYFNWIKDKTKDILINIKAYIATIV